MARRRDSTKHRRENEMYPEMNKTRAGLVIEVLFTPTREGTLAGACEAPGEVSWKGTEIGGTHPAELEGATLSSTEGMSLETRHPGTTDREEIVETRDTSDRREWT